MDKLKEECGVMGVIGDPEAANLIYLGLYALQHRGQEACGIVTVDEASRKDGEPKLLAHKSFGLVSDSVTRDVIDKLTGHMGIGHVRYSTQGGRQQQNIQPFFFNSSLGPIAIAHNGNLTNANALRRELVEDGSIFQSTSDSEIFLHLLAKGPKRSMIERIANVMEQVRGAYSLVLLTGNELYAIRDPHGFRPLVLGKKDSAFVVASETCAFDLIDATTLREVEPGEVVAISSKGFTSSFPVKPVKKAFCAFEPIYFARPDSRMFGSEMYALRKRIGAVLAEENPVEADIVLAVPDSGVPMALGYAAQARLPLEIGLVRNHYIGRTFIEPTQAIRDFGVKLKLNPILSVLSGKRVIVVDDSIVRGTTSTKIIRMLRKAGASEIHLRIGSPPVVHSCFYGIDTPKRADLLAANMSVKKMRDHFECDSLAFLSQGGLRKALADKDAEYCMACFDGKYAENIFCQIPAAPTDIGGPGLYDDGKQ